MNDIKNTKKTSFMMNVLTIVFAQVVVKMLGLVYRMVITNFEGFGDAGNGYLNFGYQIYTLLLAISSVGIPNAISKLVAERIALGDNRGARDIFKSALALFAVIGGLLSAGLYFGADFIAVTVYHAPDSALTMRALSPAIFFVAVSSVVRGYFAGQKNMNASATSQMLEQLLKCVLTISVVYALIGHDPYYMAAGANFATTGSIVLSFIYLSGYFLRHRNDLPKENEAGADYVHHKFSQLAKMILYIAVPISLSSVVTSLNRVLDSATIVAGIEKAFAGLPGFPTPESLSEEGVRLSGQLSKSDALVNLPLALNVALATTLVPHVSAALALGKRDEAAKRISFSLLLSVIIGLPATAGYIALSKNIFDAIYPNANEGAALFAAASCTIIFSAVAQTVYGALQGLGGRYVLVPAASLLVGCVVKYTLNRLLIPIPEINIFGAPISSVVCQFIAMSLSLAFLRRGIKLRLGFFKYIVKPLVATALMFGAVKLTAHLLSGFHAAVIVIVGVAVGVIVYAAAVWALSIFDYEEMLMLPFGSKIAKFARKN